MSGTKVLCAIAALLGSTSALAQTGEWRLSEASGRVVVRDAAGDHPVGRGAVVPAGATLMTGPGARAVAVRGEDFVTVAANSRLRVPAVAQQAGLFQMVEEWGSAVFKIKHLPKPHFAVQTPYLAAVVKGTTFSVTVTGEGASLQVIDGAVEVATSDGGAHELVRPGVVATVSAADRFRLAVQGETSRTIDSPARPAGGATPASSGNGGEDGQPRVVKGDDDITWSDVSSNMVAAPIEAKPVDLGALTGGLVSGRSGAEVAALVAPARDVKVDAPGKPATAEASAAAASKTSDPKSGGAEMTTDNNRAPDPAANASGSASGGATSADNGKADMKGDGKAADAGKQSTDDANKAADDKSKADAQKPVDDAAKKAADDKAKSDADAQKAADEKAKADAQKAADDKAKADAQKATDDKAKADAQKAADDKAKADADAKKAADDAAKKAADDKAKSDADAQKAADDAAKKAADDKAKADAQKADDKAKADADAKKAADDAAKQAADDAKKAADAAKKAAEDDAKDTGDPKDGKGPKGGKGDKGPGKGKDG